MARTRRRFDAWLLATALSAAAQLLTLDAAHAQAGPPLLTDDPSTPGDGRWEINLAFTVEQRRSETLFEAPILDLNYGLGERVQLKYELRWLVLDEEGAAARNGLGNSQVGVKWRFLDEERHGVSVSVYPQLSFNNPTSSDERGLIEEGLDLSLPMQVSRSVGPIELTLELGYVLVEGREDEWLYGLAAAWPVTDGFEIVGEVHDNATREFEEDELVFNLGGVVDLHENLSLLVSAGRSFHDPGSGEPELLSYLGLQFRF